MSSAAQSGRRSLEFGAFRLDFEDQRLWDRERPIPLRPKTFGVLRLLLEEAGHLVTSESLLSAVWGDVAITTGTLTQSIRELRRALGDDARRPKFIETVPRRGYRFVADLRQDSTLAPRRKAVDGMVVGRDEELRRLQECLQTAQGGERQLVFVTGEAGIGKTTVVQHFLESLSEHASTEPVWCGLGRSVELQGDPEPFLPVLSALQHPIREPRKEALPEALTRFAPDWLRLLPSPDSRTPEKDEPTVTPSRMLREICVALEQLSLEHTLILWLEDLHWGDLATVDFLSTLASRPDMARLLTIASYRPAEAAMERHAVARLKRSLRQRGLCHELALEAVAEDAMADYLRARFTWTDDLGSLPAALYEHCEGNPLFMVTLANAFATDADSLEPESVERSLRERGTETLREAVQTQLDRLSDEDIEMLEAASAVGDPFSVPAVAAALDTSTLDVENVCSRLASWQLFVSSAGELRWPDTTVAARYEFGHAVFRRLLYDRVPAARRQLIHRRVGDRLESAFAGNTSAVASELAHHFERGGEALRAVPYLAEAGALANRRRAPRETVAYLTRALEILANSTTESDGPRKELELREQLAGAQVLAGGAASDELCANLDRLLALTRTHLDSNRLAATLLHLARVHHLRAEYSPMARRLQEVEELRVTSERPALQLVLSAQSIFRLINTGQLPHASEESGRAQQLLDSEPARENPTQLANDPRMPMLIGAVWIAWLTGHPARAEKLSARLERHVDERETPYVQLWAYSAIGEQAVFARDLERARAASDKLARLKAEHGLVEPPTLEGTRQGWLLAQQGETAAAVELLERRKAEMAHIRLHASVLFATLAEIYLSTEDSDAAARTLDDAFAFVEETGERIWESELHRLRGEVHLLAGDPEEGLVHFDRALEVSRLQAARSLELRASTSAARLLAKGGRVDEVRSLLEPVCATFTEGLGTYDFCEAKALLAEI